MDAGFQNQELYSYFDQGLKQIQQQLQQSQDSQNMLKIISGIVLTFILNVLGVLMKQYFDKKKNEQTKKQSSIVQHEKINWVKTAIEGIIEEKKQKKKRSQSFSEDLQQQQQQPKSSEALIDKI